MGFGAAAMRVVQRGQLSPRTVDGAAVGATFTVRIPFNLAE
jgi:protein TonB